MTEMQAAGGRVRMARAAARFLISHGFPGCSLLLRNGYKLLGKPPAGPACVQTIHGFKMQVDPLRNKGVDASVYFNGTYEAGCIHVIEQTLRPGDTFIDAGANIGLMTLAASQAVGPAGQVHAFEPVPGVFRLLEQNVALNGFLNVRLHRQALGASSEERTIYEQSDINNGSASFVPPVASGTSAHPVSIVALDRFVEAAAIASVRMIKADVEGWELELVKGASTLLKGREAPALCIEYSPAYSPRREQLPDLYDFIRSINAYQVFKLKYGKETQSPLVPIRAPADLPRHDNIFCFLPEQIEQIGTRLFR